MSQHDASGAHAPIIADLACLVGEMAEIQAEMSALAERHAAVQARLGYLICDLARPAALASAARDLAEPVKPQATDWLGQDEAQPASPEPQAATPAPAPPGQDTAGPVQVGSASDERSGRGAGEDRPDQSEECAHVAEPVEAVSPAVETGSAAETLEQPRVPRRVEAEQTQPRSARNQVLDHYAEHGQAPAEVAKALGISNGSVSAYISTGRSTGDPRAAEGDRKRGVHDILRRSPSSRPGKRAEATASPAAVTATPATRPAPTPAQVQASGIRIPDGLLIFVKAMDGEVHGPGGIWRTTSVMAKAAGAIADGQMYGFDRIARLAGIGKEMDLVGLIPVMQFGLAKIGIDLVHTKGIGCRLRALGEAAF